jgi:IS30 family transposase
VEGEDCVIRKDKYLNLGERYIIEYDLRSGKNPSEIARKLGRHRSTVTREIRRGGMESWDTRKCRDVWEYNADAAHRLSLERQETKGSGLKIGNDIHTAMTLESLIKDNHWSPDAALGYAKRNNLIMTTFSTPTLYAYIKAGVLDITEKDLPRHGQQKRRKQKIYRTAHNNVRGTSIEERPKHVLEREEFGHWEGDLIVGKQGTRTVVMTLVERKTRKVLTKRFPGKHAKNTIGQLDYLEKRYGRDFYTIFKTITFDNGSEFLTFKELEESRYKGRRQKRTQVYYAHPYCSSERGSNENANGLLRRGGIRKGTNIGLLSDRDIDKATEWVNDMPRKILDYRTANQAWTEELDKLNT